MKKRKEKHRHPPEVVLDRSTEELPESPLDPGNLRDLGIHCLLKTNPEGIRCQRKTFTVENMQRVKHWLFVYVPTLSIADMQKLEAAAQQFGTPLPVVAKRSFYNLEAPLTELGRCRLTKGARSKQRHADSSGSTLSALVHDPHLLGFMGYPKTGVRLDAQPGSGRALSLDCEMSLAGSKRVLTRIAVVDFESEAVLLDTFVKPAETITDYVTQFSGIKADMLEGVTTDLPEIQRWLREHVGTTDILMGHSLESDLNVLEVTHDRCIDTALVFPHHKGLPMRSGLKYLAKKFLDLEIQGPTTPEKPGHDPVEDALACVKLIKAKLESGPDFGDTSGTVALTKFLSDNGLKSTIVDPAVPYWDAYGTAHVVSVQDDSEAVAKTLKALDASSFVFTTLSGHDVTAVGTSMSTLVTDAPANTLVTIWNGMGDLQTVRELQAKRQRTRAEFRTKKWDEIQDPWNDADEQALTAAETAAVNGRAFVLIAGGSQPTVTSTSGAPSGTTDEGAT